MKNLLLCAVFLFSFNVSIYAQPNCLDKAEIKTPALSEKVEKIYLENLEKARLVYAKTPNDPDAIIWLGRRTAYLGNYQEAIRIFSEGIEKHPADARFYRHRGHRYISIRCFDDAIRDFEKAVRLIENKPDEIEPDGLPNAHNQPTSTLHSNIWYHLGLAYYLKGDFKNALKAYKNALKVSKNPDMLVATTNWLYITLRRLNKTKEAEKVLKPITDNLDIIENGSYYKLIKVYQGKIKADELLREIGADINYLDQTTIGYGLGNWYLLNKNYEMAEKVFQNFLSGNQWSSFGFIASEVELKRHLRGRH